MAAWRSGSNCGICDKGCDLSREPLLRLASCLLRYGISLAFRVSPVVRLPATVRAESRFPNVNWIAPVVVLASRYLLSPPRIAISLLAR